MDLGLKKSDIKKLYKHFTGGSAPKPIDHDKALNRFLHDLENFPEMATETISTRGLEYYSDKNLKKEIRNMKKEYGRHYPDIANYKELLKISSEKEMLKKSKRERLAKKAFRIGADKAADKHFTKQALNINDIPILSEGWDRISKMIPEKYKSKLLGLAGLSALGGIAGGAFAPKGQRLKALLYGMSQGAVMPVGIDIGAGLGHGMKGMMRNLNPVYNPDIHDSPGYYPAQVATALNPELFGGVFGGVMANRLVDALWGENVPLWWEEKLPFLDQQAKREEGAKA